MSRPLTHQFINKRDVCWSPLETTEPMSWQPPDCIVIAQAHCTAKVVDIIAQESDCFRPIIVTGFSEKRTDFHVDIQLFFEFPVQALLRGFPGFDFSARKFPVATHMGPRFSSCDQYLPFALKNCRCNVYHSIKKEVVVDTENS